MRVLLTESKPGIATSVRTDLVLRGHQVFLCHTDGSDDFHCAGVQQNGTCPLDIGMVDALVDVRDESPEFTTREYGVVCAKRADVPVVVVGATAPTSEGRELESIGMQCSPAHAVDAVESVAALPDVAALHALRSGIRGVLARRTGDAHAIVTLVDHGFYVDVVVRSSVQPDASSRAEIERVAKRTLRPHRPDWVHTRVVFRQLSVPGRT